MLKMQCGFLYSFSKTFLLLTGWRGERCCREVDSQSLGKGNLDPVMLASSIDFFTAKIS